MRLIIIRRRSASRADPAKNQTTALIQSNSSGCPVFLLVMMRSDVKCLLIAIDHSKQSGSETGKNTNQHGNVGWADSALAVPCSCLGLLKLVLLTFGTRCDK